MFRPDSAQLSAQRRAIAARFAIDSTALSLEPLGQGLINTTLCVTSGTQRYVLQAINAGVFPEPWHLVRNLRRLGEHLDARPDVDLVVPRLIPTREGQDALLDAQGQVWRMTGFVAGTRTLRVLESRAQAHEVGRALGRFHRAFATLDPAQIALALPGFHDTPAVFQQLQAASAHYLAQPDEAALIEHALDFAAARRALAEVLSRAEQQGRIARRIVHGDPKLDNLLFAEDSDRVVALIDLDTVQPGLILHDLGDCLRSCCNRQGEAGKAPTFDLDAGAAILRGYAGEASALLSTEERELLPEAIALLPFELGMRFLADHLAGDRYFRVQARGENLRKARAQFALVADIERQQAALRQRVADSFPV